MRVFVKFGHAETAWVQPLGREGKTKVNEMFFWGVGERREQVCVRVRNYPATARFALDPREAGEEEVEAFDVFVRSGEFANFALKKLGDKAASWDGEHRLEAHEIVKRVRRHHCRPADRPVARDWPCWTVDFCCYAAVACFAYDPGPFAGTNFPRVRVFSATKTSLSLLKEFYRALELSPFCWWEVRGAAPVRVAELRKTRAAEYVIDYDAPDFSVVERPGGHPGTSVLCYDIEAIKDYLEPWERGFSPAEDRRREAARRALDAAGPAAERGILNSWNDHKVVNVHMLYYADWHEKAEPTRSISLILESWDGASFPAFVEGRIETLRRPELLATPTEVRHHRSERDLIADFYALVAETDPDVLTGWNLLGYDLWMTERRAEKTGVGGDALAYGRMRHRRCRCVDMQFQTAGKGAFGGKKQVALPGRVVLDGLFAMQKDFSARVSLDSYSLNRVAEHYLADKLGRRHATKDDLPYSKMRAAFSTPAGRHTLASYCLKDTKLTADVVQTMDVLLLYENTAKHVQTEISAVVFKGETERTLPVLTRFHEAREVVFVMEEKSTRAAGQPQVVQGGFVHTPRAGPYDCRTPVGVFDFKSMYPCVIRAFELDPTTVGKRDHLLSLGYGEADFRAYPARRLEGGSLVVEPVRGDTLCNLRAEGAGTPVGARPGVCPEVARSGMEQRTVYKAQKKEAAAAGDKKLAAIKEQLELACKATGNSLYGISIQPHCPVYNPDMVSLPLPSPFLASRALTPLPPQANLTTQIARDLNLTMTHRIQTGEFASLVEDDAAREACVGVRLSVVYGDTDSVFVRAEFPPDSLALHGPDMRPFATKLFAAIERDLNVNFFRSPLVQSCFRDARPPVDKNGPIEVEYENMYCPLYLFEEKKTYVAVKNDLGTGRPLTGRDGSPLTKVAGGQGKKRNNAPLVRQMEEEYHAALVAEDVADREAISRRLKAITARWARDIARDRLPWSNYVASTKLSKAPEAYDVENVATALAGAISARDPGRYLAAGDRISYLVVERAGEGGKRKRESVEEVSAVVRQNLQVDCEAGLQNIARGTALKFLKVAGLDGAAAAAFLRACKTNGGDKPVPKKPTRRPPSNFGGMTLTLTRACAVCRGPSPGGGAACETCAGGEAGAAALEEERRSAERLRALHLGYVAKCRECRASALAASGARRELADIEEAVEACENSECSTWLDRHWARRRQAGPP